MIPRFKDLPIKIKLIAVTTTITFVALILATAVHIVYVHHTAKARLAAEQRVLAQIIADRSTAALSFGDERVAVENLTALAANDAVEQACIYDAERRLFADYSPGRSAAGGGCRRTFVDSASGFVGETYLLTQPILLDGTALGLLTLKTSLVALYEDTRSNVLVAIGVLAGALALATLSAMILQRWVSLPIARLAQTAAHITTTQDYDARAESAGADEVGQLVDTFNSMVAAVRTRDVSLRRSEARYRRLVEGISAILYRADGGAGGEIRYISPQVERILGYPPKAWIERPGLFRERLHEDDRERVLAILEDCRRTGRSFDCEYRMMHRDGHQVHIRDEGSLVRDGEDKDAIIQGLRYDVSARKQAEAKIEHLAYHDVLTGLPNRLRFKDQLAAAVSSSQRYGHRFAVHFLDLDRFKDINDSLGHPVGDELLKAVARRLSGVVRKSDNLARFGGDEFAAIQQGIETAEDASSMAQRFIDSLREPFILGENRVRIGTSVGVFVSGHHSLDVDTVMTQADVALYRAKEAPDRSFAFFEESMTVALQREMLVTSQLPLALETGELFLCYQPQIDLATRRITGLEVLARWTNPTLGVVTPLEFIGIAERHGQIGDIGRWVLDRACAQAAEWLAAGIAPPCIAINVSAVQLRSNDFADLVLECISGHGIPPGLVELEFTESVFLDDTDENLRAISRLSDQGVQFSIDDFGTGFSSLAYLRKFQVDKLKIDQTFIRNMAEHASDAEIVRATLALGRALGLVTLAEGVETAEQADLLQELGCVMAQGYYFGRPMPEQEITQRLRHQADKPEDRPIARSAASA